MEGVINVTKNENGGITITALDRSRTFAGVEDLANHVAEVLEYRGGILDSMEIAAVQELARQNGASRPEVERIARATAFFEPSRPKIETPLDGRITETEAEVEAAETARLEVNEAWRSAMRSADLEYRQRVHRAARNPAKLLDVAGWAANRKAHVGAVEADFRAADDVARRARARLCALQLAADRWSADQEVRVRAGGSTLTLQEFEKWREQEGR